VIKGIMKSLENTKKKKKNINMFFFTEEENYQEINTYNQ